MNHSWRFLSLLACVALMLPAWAGAQELTGSLIGTVKDEQGSTIPGARVRLSSPELMRGSVELVTNEKGVLRFAALPPGDARSV